MLLKRVIMCGVVLLIGASSAFAEEPTALTSRELDGVTVLGFLPDLLNQLRITVEGETDDSDSLADEIIMEELEERRLRLAAGTQNSPPAGAQNSPPAGAQNSPPAGSQNSPPAGAQNSPPVGTQNSASTGMQNSAAAGTQNSAAAGTQNPAAAARVASGGDATGSWTSSPTSYRTSTRTSSATDRVEPARSSSASKDVSRSRTPAWSSQQSVASAALHQRMPNERATTDVISTTAPRAWASPAQMRAEAGGNLRRLRHQGASPRP
jgi:hypothetical protein